MIPYLLVLLGLALIYIEFYLPGGIMAILGGAALITAIILFAMHSDSSWALFLFIAGTLAGVVASIRLALWRIVKAKPEYSIYSSQDQAGFQASSFDKTAIGKKGVVVTDLKPGGFITIEGRRQAAISLSGYITKGEEVVVVDGQEQSLIVKISNKEKKS